MLLEAYEEVPLEATSDLHDAALARQREVMAELVDGDRELGLAAMATFRARRDERDEVRRALLEVAARCDPEGTAPFLEKALLTYDVELGLGLRTRATELLAETSPERALECITPILLDPPNATMPPRETLVRAWAAAALATGQTDPTVLADVSIDIAEMPAVRGAAIHLLPRFGGQLARKALEETLLESTSDALLRRKAAQALDELLEPDELCPILRRASEHEHDEAFLLFLSSMMAKRCQ